MSGVSISPGAIAFTVTPAGSELVRQRLGEADDAGLRRGVVREARSAAVERGGGRDVDDAPQPAADHVAEGTARAHAVGAVQVDVDHALPALFVEIGERHEVGDAGAVHEDVDRAERVARLGRRPRSRSRRRDVGLRPAARCPAARISSGDRPRGSRRTSSTATFAPSRARRSAIARPIPDAPPVRPRDVLRGSPRSRACQMRAPSRGVPGVLRARSRPRSPTRPAASAWAPPCVTRRRRPGPAPPKRPAGSDGATNCRQTSHMATPA